MKRTLIILGVLTGLGAAVAQVAPDTIWGAIYTLVNPTLNNRQWVYFRADSSGKLRTDLAIAPGGCDGTIDLSTGCAQPMLGAL